MSIPRTKVIVASLLLLTAGGIALKWDSVRRLAILAFDIGYAVTTSDLQPSFDGPDLNRERRTVSLVPVLEGLSQPVDLQAIPGTEHQALVLQKTGELWWADLALGEKHQLLDLEVVTQSEQGLLGAALSPDFSTSKRVFLDYVIQDGSDFSVIQEFTLQGTLESGRLVPGEILLRVEQPYQNHNAGQLAFGPDGMLYITMGDGGFRFDPKGNGQNLDSLLGSILRVDVSVPGSLSVPPDNPFVGQEGARPELWAIGLRNPWRMSFTPDGRLIVADVGQDKWEEINLVQGGDNLGWNTMEGAHCLEDGCQPPKSHLRVRPRRGAVHHGRVRSAQPQSARTPRPVHLWRLCARTNLGHRASSRSKPCSGPTQSAWTLARFDQQLRRRRRRRTLRFGLRTGARAAHPRPSDGDLSRPGRPRVEPRLAAEAGSEAFRARPEQLKAKRDAAGDSAENPYAPSGLAWQPDLRVLLARLVK